MMKMMTRTAIGVALLAGLSACDAVKGIDFDSLNGVGEDLEARYGAGNAEITQMENLRTTGSASYEGAAFFSDGEANESTSRETSMMASEVSLTADFANSSIGGEFSNFRSKSGGDEIEGRLVLSEGRIRNLDGDASFDANLDGTIGADTFDGVLGGMFVGDQGQAMSGLLEGEMINEADQPYSTLSGTFIAVED